MSRLKPCARRSGRQAVCLQWLGWFTISNMSIGANIQRIISNTLVSKNNANSIGVT